MISKRHIIFSGFVLVVTFGILIWGLTMQTLTPQHSTPRVIETQFVHMEVEQIKQISNVVTVHLLIENYSLDDIQLSPSQILISVEPFYQDHVHEATAIKTLDYVGGMIVPASTTLQVIVEFDVNHDITTDYYFLYSPTHNFVSDKFYYSMILS